MVVGPEDSLLDRHTRHSRTGRHTCILHHDIDLQNMCKMKCHVCKTKPDQFLLALTAVKTINKTLVS